MSNQMSSDSKKEMSDDNKSLRLNNFGVRTANRKRVGRGNASGVGKTCGRGQKGQKSRSGSGKRIGFEGGQMPLQRRLPKLGFRSHKPRAQEVRLDDLNRMDATEIDFDALVKHGVVSEKNRRVKVVRTGKLEKAVTLKGIATTAGASEAIKSAGGKVE